MFSVLAVKILLIFFPGIMGVKIMEIFTKGKKKYTNTEWIVNSFLLGAFSYLIVSFFPGSSKDFISIFSNVESLQITLFTFSWTLIISVLLSFILSLALNKDVIHTLGRWLDITIETPHNKVITDIYSSVDPYLKDLRGRYVTVRRYDLDVHYIGFVKRFELEGNSLELLLDDVTVYYHEVDSNNVKQEKSYDIKSVYLNLNTDSISIEFN